MSNTTFASLIMLVAGLIFGITLWFWDERSRAMACRPTKWELLRRPHAAPSEHEFDEEVRNARYCREIMLIALYFLGFTVKGQPHIRQQSKINKHSAFDKFNKALGTLVMRVGKDIDIHYSRDLTKEQLDCFMIALVFGTQGAKALEFCARSYSMFAAIVGMYGKLRSARGVVPSPEAMDWLRGLSKSLSQDQDV